MRTLRFQINYSEEGLQAIVFTAQGDMRQALNNLQATFHGFGTITPDNVFKVSEPCEPHFNNYYYYSPQPLSFLTTVFAFLNM